MTWLDRKALCWSIKASSQEATSQDGGVIETGVYFNAVPGMPFSCIDSLFFPSVQFLSL